MQAPNPSDLSWDALRQFVLDSVDVIWLTTEEISAIASDLDLQFSFAFIGDASGPVETKASARRSLASKGLVQDQSGELCLQPWFQVVVSVVTSPVIVVRVEHKDGPDHYEWTFFVDHLLGLQQQASDDGVVAWSPFDQSDLPSLLFEAGALRDTKVSSLFDVNASFNTDLVSAIDDAIVKGDLLDAAEMLCAAGVDQRFANAYVGASADSRKGSALVVHDARHEPALVTEIRWLELGEGQYVQVSASPADGSNLRLRSIAGMDIATQIAQAVGVETDGLSEGEESP